MEGFIIALIVMAVGAMFGQKKKEEAPAKKPARPQETRSQPGASRQRNYKRVEDYAKEIYGELQNQMKDQPERTEQVKQVVQKAAKAASSRETRQEVQEREGTGRLSAHQNRPLVRNEQPASGDKLFPLDKNDISKGIILAEILMPPKSKR
ncbi:hypothetical protein [Planococcus sp. YIM B11945]|uniref:hypothetical protein n=1 Tax=Planococcus sp. YIM B11945 TaxID=3435410 RepID=UPI003D7D2471